MASSGPRSISFKCNCNFRFRNATRNVFFSTSSCLCRISRWYLPMRSSCSLSLTSKLAKVSLSWSLCAFVFSASIFTRASSLSTMTCCISRSCVRCFTAFRGFLRASIALFMVALSDAADNTFCSIFWRSTVTIWMFAESCPRPSFVCLPSSAIFFSSSSTWVMAAWSRSNCAATASASAVYFWVSSTHWASCKPIFPLSSSKDRLAVICLFSSRLVPIISFSTSRMTSLAASSCVWAAAKASSRLASCTRELFHCCSNCFFSKATKSISWPVSARSLRASADSSCCFAKRASVTAMRSPSTRALSSSLFT
mmetsp:Transcript_25697/g.72255  ORF Transcript_25697/g.72255 Transcript_25697/m.72255 type:complete len:311 (-) Transcript_25697:649-1581(-)